MITDCAKQEGAPQSDLDLILSKQAPTTPQGICIGACVGEASGMVRQFQSGLDEWYVPKNSLQFHIIFVFSPKIKDNKINVEATVSVTKMAFDGDAEKMALAREFATACADVTDADRCQAAFKVFECMKKLAIDKGIKYDEM